MGTDGGSGANPADGTGQESQEMGVLGEPEVHTCSLRDQEPGNRGTHCAVRLPAGGRSLYTPRYITDKKGHCDFLNAGYRTVASGDYS